MSAALCYSKPNMPAQFFEPGDVVRIRDGGLQTFRVVESLFYEANGQYLVHGKFGCVHMWQWQDRLVAHGA